MITLVLVVVALGAGPAPTPASGPATPLRTVVYKISVQQVNAAYIEQYRTVNNQRAIFTDEGTATVDVMLNIQDVLGLRVTELTRQRGYAAQFLGNVAPDGLVNFGDDSISDSTRELLPYFGVRFVAEHGLDAGDTWKTPVGEVTVRKRDQGLVTLEITERFKVENSVSEVRSHGSVVYEPSMLVPISGDIVRTRTEQHAEGSIEITESIHFERVTDSFEPVQR